MNRVLFLVLGILLSLTALFLIIEWMEIPFLSEPAYLNEKNGTVVVVISIGLLTTDILLPIPGSVIMMGNSAVFGIWIGTIISMTGSLLSTFAGYLIGNRFSILAQRLISDEEFSRGEIFMKKYGFLAIAVSRPIPLMSETLSIIVGMLKFNKWKMALASMVGFLPAVFIYSLIGASVIGSKYSILSLIIVIIVSGGFWFIGIFWSKKGHQNY